MEPQSHLNKIIREYMDYCKSQIKESKEPIGYEDYLRLHKERFINPLMSGLLESSGVDKTTVADMLKYIEKKQAEKDGTAASLPKKDSSLELYETELRDDEKYIEQAMTRMYLYYEKKEVSVGRTMINFDDFLTQKAYLLNLLSLSHVIRSSMGRKVCKHLLLETIEQRFEVDILLSAMSFDYMVSAIVKSDPVKSDEYHSLLLFCLSFIVDELNFRSKVVEDYNSGVMDFIDDRFTFYKSAVAAHLSNDYSIPSELISTLKRSPLKPVNDVSLSADIYDEMLLKQLLMEYDNIIAKSVREYAKSE